MVHNDFMAAEETVTIEVEDVDPHHKVPGLTVILTLCGTYTSSNGFNNFE